MILQRVTTQSRKKANLKNNHHLHRLNSVRTCNTPLKRSLSGYELELVTLDENGFVVNKCDDIIRKTKSKHPSVQVVREAGKHMLEVQSFPKRTITDTSINLLENLEKVTEVAKLNGCLLFPFGTYPGELDSSVRKGGRYDLLGNILSQPRYNDYIGKCFGFHYHYTLPRTVFNKSEKNVRLLTKSKLKQSLINSYNFLIAADPAVTTLLQSSPFCDGKYYAKDSRMLFWRGGKRLKFKGLFSEFQSLGALPAYKQTMTDLIQSLKRKDARIKKEMVKAGYDAATIEKKQALDFIWNPVKINKLGTLESRSADMNFPSNIISCGFLIKRILREIQEIFLYVMPSDIGIEEPFKIEGNAVYIPPHTHVRNRLQYLSAYEGLTNRDMHNYCQRFVRLAKNLLDKKYWKIVKKTSDLIQNNKTVSDILISQVRKKGYGLDEKIPNDICAEIACNSSKNLIKDIDKTKKLLENI